MHSHTTKDYTLTVEQIPPHNHSIGEASWNHGGSKGRIRYETMYLDTTLTSGNAGGGKPHSHGDTFKESSMPPYITISIWKRVS